MDTTSILFAKFAGLQTNLKQIIWNDGRAGGSVLEPLFILYQKCTIELKALLPELYSDLPEQQIPVPLGIGLKGEAIYSLHQAAPIIQSINYILEVRTYHRLGEKRDNEGRPKRIFISHGRSKEWHKVQAFIEKVIQLPTIELAQQPILGRTVLQKLNDEANRCGYAVVVMTGDDQIGDEVRARENVLHEIGYFQGKYGLHNIIILHEEGVNIPSNIDGLVYIPFPKDTIEATFGAIVQELKLMTQ